MLFAGEWHVETAMGDWKRRERDGIEVMIL
jgi:hypothetical protein